MLIETQVVRSVRTAEGVAGAPCHEGRHLSERGSQGLGADHEGQSGGEGGGCDLTGWLISIACLSDLS